MACRADVYEIWNLAYLLCSPLSDIPGDLLGAGKVPVPAEVTFLLSDRHQVGRVHRRVHHLDDISLPRSLTFL